VNFKELKIAKIITFAMSFIQMQTICKNHKIENIKRS